jgi:hypothetical protein
MHTIGITPRLSGDVLRVELTLDPAGSTGGLPLETVTLELWAPALWFQAAEHSLGIEWLGTVSAVGTEGRAIQTSQTAECCVVCEGAKICACRVEASCGWCCVEACGGCEVSTKR